ncbi:MAG: hypothetical protein C0505_07005 [Leptothrix sp. (in: Bacteria)]|nr:hypothetical protein [Leptothrix sp. (in: b-proteobacteria)]
MRLEGELRVSLRLRAGRIESPVIASTRPDIATMLLQGRRHDEVLSAVPRLFSICAVSQALACRLALSAAQHAQDHQGDLPDKPARARARAELARETVRESTWQLLLQVPRWIAEVPTAEATATARAARGWQSADDDTATVARAIAQAVFGCAADQWLALACAPDIARWAADGGTAAARLLHGLAADGPALPTGAATALLPAPQPEWLASLAAQATADPAIARRPTWQGRPAETGALARLQGDPVLGTRASPPPSRAWARHAARLRELALLLMGDHQPGVGAIALAPGSGVAWVDSARGLLVHHVQLDGERVRVYRIVAPTEWNFHPQGALAAELNGARAADTEAARRLARRLIDSLDPCVACEVDVHHA